jgi:CheY-like chemotaxis protein
MAKKHNRDGNPDSIVVLYVEDEPANQMAMRAIFASHPEIELLEAADDDDVIEVLEDIDVLPDVVLMDHGLGHTTGEEVRT